MLPASPPVFSATAYGTQLSLQMLLVERWFPEALSAVERGALAAARALDQATRDALATALRGKTLLLPAERFPGQTALVAQLAGWLEPASEAQGQTSFLAAAPKKLRIPNDKRLLWERIEALCFHPHNDDAGVLLTRLAMGHYRALPGSPLQHAWHGSWPSLPPQQLLTGPAASGQSPQEKRQKQELKRQKVQSHVRPLAHRDQTWHDQWLSVQAAAGQALPWPCAKTHAAVLDAAQLWQAVEDGTVPSQLQSAVLSDLRRAPLDPATTRRLWRHLWQKHRRRAWRQRIAQHVAPWKIWPSGEQLRWRMRADGERRQAREPWPTRNMVAHLEHTEHGVRANGEHVETFCLRQFAANGWEGVHAEGSIWQTLLLILAAPLLSDVSGSTQSWSRPFSARPSDWQMPGFLARRQAAWGKLARALQADAHATFQLGLQRWGLDPEAQEPWNAYAFGPQAAPAAVHAVISRLPPRWLTKLLERLLEHPRHSAGLPDLVVWRTENELQLWEVKSPNDSLSDQQRSWLAWFNQHDIEAGVLRLRSPQPEQSVLFTAENEKIEPEIDPEQASLRVQQSSIQPPSLPIVAQNQRHSHLRRQKKDDLPRISCLYTIDWHGLQPPTQLEDNGHLHIMADGLTVETVLKRAQSANPARLRIVPAAALFFANNPCGRLIPAGHGLAMMWREEPLPNGEMGRVARLIWRRAGWFLPHEAGWEPVLLPRRLQPNRSATLDASSEGLLQSRLEREPIHPEHVVNQNSHSEAATAWQQQAALLQQDIHAVGLRDDQPTIALPPDAAVMWVSDSINRINVPLDPRLHPANQVKRRRKKH